MSKLLVSTEGPRADVILNRPEMLNAMDFDMFDLLAEAVDELAGLDELRVVVVSGSGRSFSSGIDVSSFGTISGGPAEMIARAQAGFRKLADLPVPTIAKLHGHALGAGLQVGLACDLRVVATDALLGLLETDYGLIPDLGGSTQLPRLIGTGRAKKMIWLGEQITGDEAAALGLAEAAVPPSELDDRVDELAAAISQRPAVPVREAKALVNFAWAGDIASGMDREADAQERCMTDPSFAAAMMEGLRNRKKKD